MKYVRVEIIQIFLEVLYLSLGFIMSVSNLFPEMIVLIYGFINPKELLFLFIDKGEIVKGSYFELTLLFYSE